MVGSEVGSSGSDVGRLGIAAAGEAAHGFAYAASAASRAQSRTLLLPTSDLPRAFPHVIAPRLAQRSLFGQLLVFAFMRQGSRTYLIRVVKGAFFTDYGCLLELTHSL